MLLKHLLLKLPLLCETSFDTENTVNKMLWTGSQLRVDYPDDCSWAGKRIQHENKLIFMLKAAIYHPKLV